MAAGQREVRRAFNSNRIAGGGSASGAFTAPAMALVEWTGGTFTLNPGVQINGTGLDRINGGTLTANANSSVENFDLVTGTLNGTGALMVNALMNWTSGTMSGSRRTVVSSGATLT